MAFAGRMWECKCGHIEYGDDAPEECPKCADLDSFIQLPEELVAERERDMLQEEIIGKSAAALKQMPGEDDEEFEEEISTPKKKTKVKKSAIKTKKKKR